MLDKTLRSMSDYCRPDYLRRCPWYYNQCPKNTISAALKVDKTAKMDEIRSELHQYIESSKNNTYFEAWNKRNFDQASQASNKH